MSQSLPQEREAYVQQKLESGEFHSRDEFERVTIRVYRDLEQRHTELKTRFPNESASPMRVIEGLSM